MLLFSPHTLLTRHQCCCSRTRPFTGDRAPGAYPVDGRPGGLAGSKEEEGHKTRGRMMNFGAGLLPAAARPDIFTKGVILVHKRSKKKHRRRHHSRRVTAGHEDYTDDEGPKYYRKDGSVPEALDATTAKKSNQEDESPGRAGKAGVAGPTHATTIDGLELNLNNTAWSPDGKKVATEVLEKKVVLLDVSTGRRLGVWDANQTTVQDAVVTGQVAEEQRVQDIEDVDVMRRHLMTARDRADEAEKELKRVRQQLREMREAHEEAVERVVGLEEEGGRLRRELEASDKQVTKSLERLAASDHSCREGERREKNLGARVKELEDRLERMDLQHTAEVRQLRQELDIARLKVEVEQTRTDVRRLEAQQDKGMSGAFAKMFGAGGGGGAGAGGGGGTASSPLAAASSSLATTLKSLTGMGGGSASSPAAGRAADGAASPVEAEAGPKKLTRTGTVSSALTRTLKSAATTASECNQS